MFLLIAGGLELHNLWRSHLVQTILWFCEFIWILLFTHLYHCTSKHLAKNVIALEATETYKNHICLSIYMTRPPPPSRKWQSLAAGRPVCSFPSNTASGIYLTATWGFSEIMKIRTNTRGWSMIRRLWGCQRCSELTRIIPVGQQLKGAECWVMNFLSNIFAMWAYNMALPSVLILQLYC